MTDLLVTNNYDAGEDATTAEVKADFCTTIVKRTSEGVILDVYDVNGELLHTQIFLADDYDVDKNWKELKTPLADKAIKELQQGYTEEESK